MGLTREEVEHIAALARLELSEEDKASFQIQLSGILDYVGQMSKVETAGVEPLSHTSPVINVMRPDEVRDCPLETRRRLIEAFPDKEGDLLKVKAVFS